MRDSRRSAESGTGATAEILSSAGLNNDILVVARGGGLVLISTVGARAINYIYSAVLIRGWGGENFGLFTLALAVTMFLGVVADLGLGLGIVRFGAIHSGNQGRIGIHHTTMVAIRVTLLVSLLVLAGVLATADIIAGRVFGKPQLASLIRLLGLNIPLMATQSLMLAATRALKIMKYSVYSWIIQPIAGLLFAVPLLVLHYRIEAVALSLVASHVAGTAVAIYAYLQVMPAEREGPSPVPIGRMLRYSAPLSVTQWIHYANERTEVFFLGLLPRALDVGIYNIGWRLAGLETVFRLSLEHILAPFSSEFSHKRKIPQLESLYKTTAKWGFTVALMLCLIYTLFARTIMNVFDPSFVAGAYVLTALAFAQLFNEFTGACNTILIMSGRSGLSLMNTVILFVSSIALDWLLIPRHGLAGAAVAGALTIILVNVLRVTEVWLTLGIHPFKWSFLKPALAGLVSAAVVSVLRRCVYSGPLLADLLYAVLLIAGYIAALLILKLDAEDMVVINAVKRKFAGRSPEFTEDI